MTKSIDAALALASPRPWAYRPFRHDDWGFVRASDSTVAALARGAVEYADEFNEHRRNKTDPYGPNAALILRAVNVFEQARAALHEALETIKALHGPVAWDIYEHNAPEIQRIKAALAAMEADIP